ncbi:MAG: M23 family metallopeptidase [Erysipelotrichales bacterium]|nr:M23 family metallopeptidase [Erysipelotrichales bacterium]
MSEIDEIKRRMEKRRARRHPTLTDHHFLKIYNAMIKCMVVLLVGVSVGAYVKVSPNGEEVKNYIFNDLHLNEASRWFQSQLSRFIGEDESVVVSHNVNYTHIKDNFYTNQTNEVLNFSKGRVIYVGKQELLGNYVTVLLENNIEVTYGQLTDVFVSTYDQIDASTIIGTCNDKVMIIFTQGEKEIDYETFEEIIS